MLFVDDFLCMKLLPDDTLVCGAKPNVRVDAFAAGGFGSKKSASKKKDNLASKKIGTRKKGFGMADIAKTKTTTAPKISSPQNMQQQPKLDKWGLPVATIDDLFPPLPSDTELIPVDPTREFHSLPEIQECLKDHIDLNLSRFFDQNGRCVLKNEDGTYMQLRLLHKSPPVLAIENFMTEAECKEIQSATSNAHQVNSATFQGSLSTRTSTSWFCHYKDVPVLLAKARHLLNMPLENMEEPQIVRYERGQEFSWHYDEVPSPQLDNGGQRLATMLVYLTSVAKSKGGGTTFRDLKMTAGDNPNELVMQPKRGSCLLFFPSFSDGTPDDRTLHKSHVLESDDAKWIVQMWIHQHDYSAVIPAGNSQNAARDIMDKTSKKLGLL
jgi:prolyl 4-hydroxylase